MPIQGPAAAKALLDVYDDLVTGATDLVGAAAQIAPAAVRDIICAAGGLGSLLGGPLGPYQSPGSLGRQTSDLGGILQAACPVPPPPPVLGPTQGPPPFEGGQCPDRYQVRIDIVRTSGATLAIERTVRGPIGGVRVLADSPFSVQILSGPLGPQNVVCASVSQGAIIWRDAGAGGSSYEGATVSLTVLQNCDGPDECGNLPGPIIPAPPIGPIPGQPESPVIPPAVPDPGIPGGGGFIFKPEVGPISIGPDGGINVPVVVNIGGPSLNIPITIPVNVGLPDFAPTVVIGGGGGISGGGGSVVPPTPPPPICCRPIPRVGPATEGEEGEPVEGDDPPARSRLVGVIVTSSVNQDVASITEIAQGGGGKNLWVPRLGSLYFDVEGENEDGFMVTASTVDAPIKTLVQYVPVPPDVTVKGFRAVPETGVLFSTSPVVVPANPSSEEESSP